MGIIEPHGGRLINRFLTGESLKENVVMSKSLYKVALNFRSACDLFMIATGAYSPLEGFMTSEHYKRVLNEKRVMNGVPWTIPITFDADISKKGDFKVGQKIALCLDIEPVAVMEIEDIFMCDKETEAKKVYGTSDEAHPGVAALYNQGQLMLGGKVAVIDESLLVEGFGLGYNKYMSKPEQTRGYIAERGWHTVVGFQTRNPIHRAHEYLIKTAMETADAVLIHPLIGPTKSDDVPVDIRMECYDAIVENYFPKDRTLIGVLPAAMRYAGPMEAIHHAIIRKNYGCSHFIVGRDHAGIGNYYGTYDAQKIFGQFNPQEIGISPLCFEHTFYCNRCSGMASYKTCPHPDSEHVILSGTKVRAILSNGEIPPVEFTRQEVAQILKKAYMK